jgi:hypothetical protein
VGTSNAHSKSHALQSTLHATLIKADGGRIELGDLDQRKPWYVRAWERMHFDERGLVTNAGAFYLTKGAASTFHG